jgi:hypothetical protein
MDAKKIILLGALTVYGLSALFACKEQSSTAKEEEGRTWRMENAAELKRLYPNGGEELAWLMRELTHKLEAYKTELSLNTDAEIPEVLAVMQEIHGAPSIRKEAGSTAFVGMTNALIYQFEKFQQAEGEERIKQYNLLIQNCEACHQAYCPGPIKRIEKLRL